jgi:hypothetical protein
MSLSVEQTIIPAKSTGRLPFAFSVPENAKPGRWVIPVEVNYAGRALGQFREAILVIK